MREQRQIIEAFRNIYGAITYREISEILGIQTTRVFRVFNGHEMKLSEYIRMKSIVEKNSETDGVLIKLIKDNEGVLNRADIKDVKVILSRRIALRNLLNTQGLYEQEGRAA